MEHERDVTKIALSPLNLLANDLNVSSYMKSTEYGDMYCMVS